MLRRLGAVQLDTISVLARSHELVAYARLGAVGRAAVEEAYWGAATRLRVLVARGVRPAGRGVADVRLPPPRTSAPRGQPLARGARRRATASSSGSRRRPDDGDRARRRERGGEWWDWSDVKVAVEWLLDIGEVVCTERRAWKRVYDLPERALPAEVLADDPDDATCLRAPGAGTPGSALGVAHRARTSPTTTASSATRCDAVVADTRPRPGDGATAGARPTWADPAALGGARPRGRHRTTLLSPFDSLVWDRARTVRVFGFQHRLEAYVPAPKRVHGYFAMPLLAGGPPARAASTRRATARRSWPSGCRASRARSTRWRRRCARRPRGSAATRSRSRSSTRRSWRTAARCAGLSARSVVAAAVAAAAAPAGAAAAELLPLPLPEPPLPLPPGVLPLPLLPPPLVAAGSSLPEVVVGALVVVVEVVASTAFARAACLLRLGRPARGRGRGRRRLRRRERHARAGGRRRQADGVA